MCCMPVLRIFFSPVRSFQVPPELKLPVLYLLDSIIKNEGGPYVLAFAAILPDVSGYYYMHQIATIVSELIVMARSWCQIWPQMP